MAPHNAYPRSVMKRIVKAHSDRNLSKNADVLIYLDYALFLQELLRESTIQSQAQLSIDGPNVSTGNKKPVITARDVRKVSKVTLRKFKG